MSMPSSEMEFKRVIGKRPKFKGAASPAPAPDRVLESEFPEEPTTETALAPMVDEAKTRALSMPAMAAKIKVTDQSSLNSAERFRADIKNLMEQVRGSFRPQISQADKLHKSLIKEEKKFLDPLEEAERIVNRQAIAPYLAAEREKKEAAERARAEAESRVREEAAKAVAKAQAAVANGDQAKADKLMDKAFAKVDEIRNAAPIVPDAPDTGLSLRREWKFSVMDAALLPAEYLMPDEKKIGRIVRASEGKLQIPGVKVWFEDRVQ
jgi:hypothetical protein